MQSKILYTILMFGLCFLAGCGGGGSSASSDPSIGTGQFKDSNTEGLAYVSGSLSGVTDSKGEFDYEIGSPITFSIGGLPIGTISGKKTITPIELVPNGNSNSTAVQNIVRLLLMLDIDGNPENGITISNAVQVVAETWSPINFATSDLAIELTSIISDANAVDGVTHVLPTSVTAKNHLESTLRCVYSGAFKGTFSGGNFGNFGFLLDPITGGMVGRTWSDKFNLLSSVTSLSPLTYEDGPSFLTGSGGMVLAGEFTSPNSVDGSWFDSLDSGSFTGSRIGGNVNSIYRFTGEYAGSDSGLFSIDIDASNKATGITYSILYDELNPLVSGSLNGTSLSGVTQSGTTISGALNTAAGIMSGTWVNTLEGMSGSFSGVGCQLN